MNRFKQTNLFNLQYATQAKIKQPLFQIEPIKSSCKKHSEIGLSIEKYSIIGSKSVWGSVMT